MDLTAPLPPGSHAWCSEPDCSWRDTTAQAHVQGRAHTDGLQHLVHVFIPPCGDIHIAGDRLFSCTRDSGHSGDIHSDGNIKWRATA